MWGRRYFPPRKNRVYTPVPIGTFDEITSVILFYFLLFSTLLSRAPVRVYW
nr:MAG TPA: hypothetical protein [Caudoviricetes sp.]